MQVPMRTTYGGKELRSRTTHPKAIELKREYWTDMRIKKGARKLRRKMIDLQHKYSGAAVLAVDGHWWPLVPIPIRQQNSLAPYFNILREPKSRVASEFMYAVYSSMAARRRAKHGVDNAAFAKSKFGSSALDDECLSDSRCTSTLRKMCDRQLRALIPIGQNEIYAQNDCGNETISVTEAHCQAASPSVNPMRTKDMPAPRKPARRNRPRVQAKARAAGAGGKGRRLAGIFREKLAVKLMRFAERKFNFTTKGCGSFWRGIPR